MKNPGKKFGYLGLALLALFSSLGLQMIVALAAGVVAGVIKGMAAAAQGGDYAAAVMEAVETGVVWGVLGYHVIALPVYSLWYYFGCGRKKPGNPARVFTVKRLVFILLASAGLYLFAEGMVLSEEFLTPRLFEQYVKLMEQAQFGVNPLTIIASVLLAPIGEELLCRGVIFHYSQKATADMANRTQAFWIANGIQALLFGILHANFVQGSYAFVLGLGLGYLRYRYNSLYPSMLAHFLVNFLSTYVFSYLLQGLSESVPTALMLLVVGALIAFLGVKIGLSEKQAGLGEGACQEPGEGNDRS